MATGGSGERCLFCRIGERKDENSSLLYQDDTVAVFRDIHPAATHHYLVIPKEHIKNAKVLTGNHALLVEKLVTVGKQVLEEQGGNVDDARMGFHWPPFQTVNHLHLHVISPQSEMGVISKKIFSVSNLWFVTPVWLIARLKNKK